MQRTTLIWLGLAQAAVVSGCSSSVYEPPPSTAENPCGLDESLPFELLGDVLQLRDPASGTCVLAVRRVIRPGGDWCAGCFNEFRLRFLRVAHDGRVIEIDDPSRMEWMAGQHNFDDHATAMTATGTIRLELDLVSDPAGPVYTVLEEGEPAWGPTRMQPYPPE